MYQQPKHILTNNPRKLISKKRVICVFGFLALIAISAAINSSGVISKSWISNKQVAGISDSTKKEVDYVGGNFYKMDEKVKTKNFAITLNSINDVNTTSNFENQTQKSDSNLKKLTLTIQNTSKQNLELANPDQIYLKDLQQQNFWLVFNNLAPNQALLPNESKKIELTYEIDTQSQKLRFCYPVDSASLQYVIFEI